MVLLVLILVIVWLTVTLVRRSYAFLAPRAARFSHRVLDWVRTHPHLGRLTAAILDPREPEAKGLLILGFILIAAAWLVLLALHHIQIAATLEQIDLGAKRRGRRVEDLEIVKRRGIYLSDDVSAGLEYFREYIGFYGAAPAYQQIMIGLGYEKTVDAIREAYAERNRLAVKQAVPDEMVTRLFAFGDSAHCQQIVRADLAAGVDSAVVSPQGTDADLYAQCAEAFGRDEFVV